MSKELLELSKLYLQIAEEDLKKSTKKIELELEKETDKESKEKKGIRIEREGGGYTTIYPGSPDYKAAEAGTLKTVGSGETRGKVTNNNGKLTSKSEIKSGVSTDSTDEKDENAKRKARIKELETKLTNKENERKEKINNIGNKTTEVKPENQTKEVEVKPENQTKEVEVKPENQTKEVEVKDYIGKKQGLPGKEKWLKDTSNSPAARSGAFTDDQRWAQQEKHRKWQKDNNRGAFKVKKEKSKVYTNKVDAFLNNKKVGDPKGTGNHKITQWQDLESYDAKGQSLSEQGKKVVDANAVPAEDVKKPVVDYKKQAPKKTAPKNVEVNPEIKEASGCGSKKKKKKKTYYEGIDAYDSVMSYLMGTSQVESIEEANYIMMEMDGKTINEIRQLTEGMPQYVRDSIGRQYGTGKYKGQKYTIEDKKNVINWYSRIKA